MSYRYMRILIMFDLPVLTSADRKVYRKFRKFLLSTGFYMLQESIYIKLVLNHTEANKVASYIRANKPDDGLVQMLIITEKQFSKMETLSGESHSDLVTTTDRLVIL
ncbi:CRISPR-associated endonuclease Cas2 [uncultured Veillonella sp.]|uniref:CRISPR-associated endonuclease Cas2 n=1 Tax=uncultured Veillonella sp. TaxID=159268 RepID=UPI0034360504